MSETQIKILKSIGSHVAAILVAVIAFANTIGAPPEEHEEILASVCTDARLELLVEFADTELCTHGPDPIVSQAQERAANLDDGPKAAELVPPAAYRQTDLCPGDGRSGSRVKVYVGSVASRPTAADVRLARITIGWAERQLRESHPTYAQKIQFYCATDKIPTIKKLELPEMPDPIRYFETLFGAYGGVNSGEFVTGSPKPDTHYVVIMVNDRGRYPYCGQGTTMWSDAPADENEILSVPQHSIVGCLGSDSTFLHELGHNIGAVQPSAPHSTGDGWHCTDLYEVMCYNDGGSGISSSNPMHKECPRYFYKASGGDPVETERFDCDFDFWQPVPALALTGYFADHFNVSDSPFLTRPRRK